MHQDNHLAPWCCVRRTKVGDQSYVDFPRDDKTGRPGGVIVSTVNQVSGPWSCIPCIVQYNYRQNKKLVGIRHALQSSAHVNKPNNISLYSELRVCVWGTWMKPMLTSISCLSLHFEPFLVTLQWTPFPCLLSSKLMKQTLINYCFANGTPEGQALLQSVTKDSDWGEDNTFVSPCCHCESKLACWAIVSTMQRGNTTRPNT